MDCMAKTSNFGRWRNRPKTSLPKRSAGEEKNAEKKSLLPSAMTGQKKTTNRKKNSKRRVQWNDDLGDKLVQVVEFLPSDSSDSEDEYVDSCICTIM